MSMRGILPSQWYRTGNRLPGLLLLSALLLGGCAPREDRSALTRRAVGPAPASGWARLPLDAGAQRQRAGLWLGGPDGRPVPFLVEREGLWRPQVLECRNQLTGRDPEGRPCVAFALKLPEGWQVREREQLKLELDLEGQAPWVARVRVERRLDEGEGGYLTLDGDAPHLYDLGGSGRSSSFHIPWEASEYRVGLEAVQGAAPRIRSLKVTAVTEPSVLAPHQVLGPFKPVLAQEKAGEKTGEKTGERTWRIRLEGPERLVGMDLLLGPPAAPIQPRLFGAVPGAAGREALPAAGLVWNLPALGTRSTRLALEPACVQELDLVLPAEAQPDSVTLLVRREVLIFPAEAGKTYQLHLGGAARTAPGDLGALPDSSRSLFQSRPLALGAGEADPEGIALPVETADRIARLSRPWLPWVTGLAVLVLGLAAWRLLGGARREG